MLAVWLLRPGEFALHPAEKNKKNKTHLGNTLDYLGFLYSLAEPHFQKMLLTNQNKTNNCAQEKGFDH